MSTFSVFRRNKKMSLAVLGVLTMLSFVFIPTLEQCNRNFLPGKQTVFVSKMFGNLTGNEFELIRQQQYAVYEVLMQGNFQGLDAQSVLSTWLKARFAEKMGFVVGDSEIRKMIRENFKSAEEYKSALESRRIVELTFEEGLKELILASKYSNFCLAGIGQQMNMGGMPFAMPAFPTTVEQQWNYFCALNRSATLDVVPVKAEDYLNRVVNPTNQEIASYFEEHKDKLANENAGVVGFKNPAKVKVHYFSYAKPINASAPEALDAPLNADNLDDAINLDDAPVLNETPEAAPAPETETAPAPEAAPEATPAASLNVENPFRLVANETVVTEAAPVENAAPEKSEEQFDAKVFARLVQSDVSAYKTALNEYRFNKTEGMEEPKLVFSDETKAYADKYSLQYVELDLMDVNTLAEQPIAQAMGFNEIMMKKIFTCIEAEDLHANYVVWKSEVEDAAVAELTDDVKKVVANAWKLNKAKELAKAAAADMAKSATEAKALTNPITVENFSQYAMTAQGPTPTDLALYEDQLNNISEEFRLNVFKMVPGEVKALPNRNNAIQYVVLLKSYSPDDAELRSMFQNIKDNPQYSQSMFMMSNYETINAIQRWEMSIFEDAGASFVENRDPYAE